MHHEAFAGSVRNPFTSGRWIMEPKPQNIWGKSHATWFTCMGVGAALFLNRVLFDLELGKVLGITVAEWLSLVVIGVGGLILIADLGKPLHFWKAYRNPLTSWISVGFIADIVFCVLAGLWAIPSLELGGVNALGWLPWAGNKPLGLLFQFLAGTACLIIIMYPGLVLASSGSIPLWNSALVPLQYLAFGFNSALGLAYLSARVGVGPIPSPVWLPVLVFLYGIGLLFLLLHLLESWYRHETGRFSVLRLIHGDVRNQFVFGALGLGVIVPLALIIASAFNSSSSLTLLAITGLVGLAGNWFSKLAIIRAGTYAPFL